MSTTPMPHTILLVDDDRSLQRIYGEALANAGFSVLTERDGDWALQTFASRPVDLVVLDALIPLQSGFQVLERLRGTTKGSKVPVIMISGVYRSARARSEAIDRWGCVAFLEKPLELADLVRAARAALGVDGLPVEVAGRLESRADRFAALLDHDEASQVEEDSEVKFQGGEVRSGDFAQTPFPQVLFELHQLRSTGALLLRRDKIKKIVYLRDGTPHSVKSNLLSECLGKGLVRARLITAAECEESLRRLKTTGRQQGAILIEMGCVSPNNLVVALQQQLETKLFDIFGWTEGEYQFNPKAAVPSPVTTLDMTLARILYEGVRRAYDEDRIRAALGDSLSKTVVLAEDPLDRFQEMHLETPEERFYAAIDGRRSVNDLVALTFLPPLEALRLVYALKCAQMIDLQTRRKGPPPPPEDLTPLPVQPPPPPEDLTPVPLTSAMSDESSADAAVRERLAARLAELTLAPNETVLGVARGAHIDDIRRAYTTLAKELHPDRHYVTASPQIRRFAEAIFARITAAYEALTSEAPTEKRRAKEADATKLLAAHAHFRAGEDHFARKEFEAARTSFARAVTIYPEESEFHALLGWTTFQSAGATAAAAMNALPHLEESIRQNPKFDRAYVFRGQLYLALGRAVEAEDDFTRAIQCNPSNREALQRIRSPS